MKKLLTLFVMSGAVLGILFLLMAKSSPNAAQSTPAITLKPGTVVQDGSVVSIEYTLTDDAGKVIDTNVGKEPLTYVHGAGQIVKGLEHELNGMKAGDQKKVDVKPEEGYGLPNPQARQEVPREKIPPEAQKVGAMLMTKTADGHVLQMRVAEVKDKTVVVDFNHPLAGKTLHFDVKVKDIKAAETK
jgi:FKBP-type peptidyl-prolyl cis-trans isomerase SlyD